MINDVVVRLFDGRMIKMVPEADDPAAQPLQADPAAQPLQADPAAQPLQADPAAQPLQVQAKRKRNFRRRKLKVWMPVSECIATCEFLTKSGNWIPVAVWDMTEAGRVFLAFVTKEPKKIKHNNKMYNEKFAYHETGTWYINSADVNDKLRM
jgi:hypothetical protein